MLKKNSHYHVVVLLISIVLLSQSGFSQNVNSFDDRIYRVSGDHNFPPYEYLNEKGEPEGYVVDMMRAVAKAANIRIDIQLKP
ncbi:MAG: transporter substrate-binding domain-containing protein, partial [Candidatus Marinimicrobia bacterium]|nr:transporter substrate-binding domain-containing protein [Candidatus Neomarinimicrobiota bacterium]